MLQKEIDDATASFIRQALTHLHSAAVGDGSRRPLHSGFHQESQALLPGSLHTSHLNDRAWWLWASLEVIQCGLLAWNPRHIVLGIVAACALATGTGCAGVDRLLVADGAEQLFASNALETMMPSGFKVFEGMAKELPIATG